MWRRSRVEFTSSATAASTMSAVEAFSQRRASASASTRCKSSMKVALLERAQQLVLVAEAGVEAAHRRAGAPRDLRDRDRRVALLLDQRLGGVEQALQRALAARLLRAR